MKELTISSMFDRIAPRYDFLNRLLSFRRDIYWRKKLVKYLPEKTELQVIDLATGTADLAITICKYSQNIGQIEGVDISEQMLEVGKQKIEKLGLLSKIRLQVGSASALNFADECFDVATVAFGVRNFSELDASLREMARVLKPDGRALVLEFTVPKNPVVRFFYLLYFRHLLPKVGGWLSKDAGAYRYLNESVETFQASERFRERLGECGFEVILEKPMTCGVVTLYIADKR